jgi:hypothetical protein
MSVGKEGYMHGLHGGERRVRTVSGCSNDRVLETEGGLVDEPTDDAEQDASTDSFCARDKSCAMPQTPGWPLKTAVLRPADEWSWTC